MSEKDAGELLPLEKAQQLLGLKRDPGCPLTPMEEEVAFARMVSERDGIVTLVCRRTGCSEDEGQRMLEDIQDVMGDGKIRTAFGLGAEFGGLGSGMKPRLGELHGRWRWSRQC